MWCKEATGTAMASPSLQTVSTIRPTRGRPLFELSVGYGLILATIWTPRPYQQWLYALAAAWIAMTSIVSFPGWEAVGFRRGGFFASLWVVLAAAIVSAGSVMVAIHLDTIRHPISARGWV